MNDDNWALKLFGLFAGIGLVLGLLTGEVLIGIAAGVILCAIMLGVGYLGTLGGDR
jgi:xanthine/uracil/vitamin C permease (AzgA family)